MITKFTSTQALTKTFTMQSDGTIVKENPSFAQGTFKVLPVTCLDDLQTIIRSLKHNEALSHTIPELDSGGICIQGYEDEENGVISRTGKYFCYRPGLGVLEIDVDDGSTEEDVIERLGNLYEPFKTSSYLYASSASNGISGKSGYHLYFLVEDGATIQQAMEHLFQKAFIAGHGYHKINKAGAALARTFFDKAVYGDAGLDFIAGPKCIGFGAPKRDIRVVEKDSDEKISLSTLLEKVESYEEALAESRAKVKPEEEIIQQKVAKARGIPFEQYRASLENKVLSPGFILPDGSSVTDILLESTKNYEAGLGTKVRPICHPIEGGYEDKTNLYLNESGSPVIHSFKNGGQTWKLQHSLETVGDNQALMVQHGLIDSKEIKKFPEHEYTESVLDLMRKTYKGWNIYLPEKACKDMINLYLNLIFESERGCYSLELRPSAGKTQTLLHLAWFLGANTKKSLSITFQQKKDIDEAYEFLASKGISVGFIYSGTQDATALKKLGTKQIILHTHHRIRDNNYSDNYFTFNGKKRDLLIFDEAYFGTLNVSLGLPDFIGKLSKAIAEAEGRNLGMPLLFMKDLLRRAENANRLLRSPATPTVTISIPYIGEKFIQTAWRSHKESTREFLAKLFNIAAARTMFEEPVMKCTRETEGAATIFYKINDAFFFDKMVTTDATRSIRVVHELSSQQIISYPVDEPEPKPGKFIIVPRMLDSKTAASQNPELRHNAIAELAVENNCKKVGYVQSNQLPLMPTFSEEGIEFVPILYGRHKQTNEFNGCDMIALVHNHRFPDSAYKHACMAEGQLRGAPDKAFVNRYKKGSVADESIQALMRGSRRNNEDCVLVMFLRDKDVVHILKDYFYADTFKEWTNPEIDAEIKRWEDDISAREREIRSDQEYANKRDRELARKFRRELRKKSLADHPDQRLQSQYLRDKEAGYRGGPAAWIKANLRNATITADGPHYYIPGAEGTLAALLEQ